MTTLIKEKTLRMNSENYTSCNRTNFTSYFDKNCKLRSQIPFLREVIISLTEMLTLTEKLTNVLRSLYFFEGTIFLILLKKECPWFFKKFVVLEMFWKIKKTWFLYPGFSCILNISRATIFVEVENKCWIFVSKFLNFV